MPKKTDPKVEEQVKCLSTSNLSCRAIVKRLKDQGIIIGRSTVSDIINNVGKRRQAKAAGKKSPVKPQPRPVATKALVGKVDVLTSKESPPSLRQMERRLKASKSTVHRIIGRLNKEKRRKWRVHKLSPKHMKDRKTNCRKLYEKVLAGHRAEYVVTLDEALFGLENCNGKRKICYVPKGQEVPEDWIVDHENFFQTFMVVGAISGRGTLPLIKVPKKTKVNADYYISNVLKPIVEKHLPRLYPGELRKVVIHHDKASSHTARKTDEYSRVVKRKYGITIMNKKDIPVKSPDCSPMDFFGFGFLKRRLFGHRPTTVGGVWKLLRQTWSGVDHGLINRTYESWKRRCRAIVNKQGRHVENVKTIHRRLKRRTKLF